MNRIISISYFFIRRIDWFNMDFNEVKEKLSTVHKLHTARDYEGETIIYKKPYSAKNIIVLTDKEETFELSKVTYMSLSELGLLIQYKPVNISKMYPFVLNKIEDIIVES